VSAGSGSDADRPRRVAVPVANVLAVVDVAPPPSPRRSPAHPLSVPESVSRPAAPPVAGSVVPTQLVLPQTNSRRQSCSEQLFPAFIAQYHLAHRSGDDWETLSRSDTPYAVREELAPRWSHAVSGCVVPGSMGGSVPWWWPPVLRSRSSVHAAVHRTDVLFAIEFSSFSPTHLSLGLRITSGGVTTGASASGSLPASSLLRPRPSSDFGLRTA
jgi:hypothetical protein